MTNEQIWIAFGLMGQFLFTGRFVVQWLSSEREKKSIIPPAFWLLSIGGAIVLLIYAFHRRDLVFIIGQSSGLLIYVRNLQLIRNEKKLIGRVTPADVSPLEVVSPVETDNRSRKAA